MAPHLHPLRHLLPPEAAEEAAAEEATSWAAKEEEATVVPRLLRHQPLHRHRLLPAAEAATGAV